MTDVIRVVLIDDHIHVHDAISSVLDLADDIELVGQGSNGLEAIQLCTQHNPDVVLMDVVMPKMNGIEATRKILEQQPHIHILVLSSFQDRDSVREMLRSGASGYLLKDGSSSDIEDFIRIVHKGKSVLSAEITDLLLQAPPKNDHNLTSRELEVLRLMARGMNNQEIATSLTVSYSTVRFHISNIIAKLDVKSRAEATALATQEGII